MDRLLPNLKYIFNTRVSIYCTEIFNNPTFLTISRHAEVEKKTTKDLQSNFKTLPKLLSLVFSYIFYTNDTHVRTERNECLFIHFR